MTDIVALVERLRAEWGVRKSSPHDYDDEITDMMAEAADTLEACQADLVIIKQAFLEERAKRGKDAAEIERLRKLAYRRQPIGDMDNWKD